jgi:tetratricopeptide (TPR) repeat protein
LILFNVFPAVKREDVAAPHPSSRLSVLPYDLRLTEYRRLSDAPLCPDDATKPCQLIGSAEPRICKDIRGWARQLASTTTGAIHGHKTNVDLAAGEAWRPVTSITAKSTLRLASSAPNRARLQAREAMAAASMARGRAALRQYPNCLQKRGGREEAVALFRRAAADAPDSGDIQLGLGMIFAKLDPRKEAIACFQKALVRAGKQAIWHHARAPAIHPDFAQAHIYRHAVGRWRHHAHEPRPLLEALDFPLTNAGSTVSDYA